MAYDYEINPRPAELGGGWRLRLLENGQEVGGGVFPVVIGNLQDCADWWDAMGEEERAHWRARTGTDVPADAWAAWMRSDAYNDAEAVACDWLDAREEA
jgi:hypothetical protein